MVEFPLFGQLPRELRELIWELALSPMGEPGVHYMTLVEDISVYGTEKSLVGTRWLGLFEDHIPRIAGPSQLPPAGARPVYLFDEALAARREWPSPLSSSCLLDYGLLAACRESRVTIERFLQSNSIESQDVVLRKTSPQALPTPMLFNFADDLFIFRFANSHMVPRQGWYLHFKHYMGLSPGENIVNIALEYNSAWRSGILDMLREPFKTLTSAVSGPGRAVDACSIWIVDYELPEDLEREPGHRPQKASGRASDHGSSPSRFYSRDRVFVETFPAERPHDDSPTEPSVFATVRLFETWLQGVFKYSSSPALGRTKIGVLRCKRLTGSR